MGHIYKFYSDARTMSVIKLEISQRSAPINDFLCTRGISSYASHPPCLVTSSLADEIARYDQTCDLIEAHLVSPTAQSRMIDHSVI